MNHLTPEQLKRYYLAIKSPERSKKISQKLKGRIPWNKGLKIGPTGRKLTEQHRQAISIANKGSNHGLWKGGSVGYESLHEWVNVNYRKPSKCEDCNQPKKLEAANVSGKYLRQREDWKFICRKCHMISDGRLVKLLSYNHV